MQQSKNRRVFYFPMGNESGSVIVAALFILVMVTVLGLTASNTSTIELQIAANDQFIKMSFYNADSALYGTSKLISLAVNESGKINEGTGNDAPGLTYLSTASDPADDFYRQISGIDQYDGTFDVDFNAGGIDSQADARRDRQDYPAGSGVEFSSGSEGVGASVVAIYYGIESSGFSNRNTTSDLSATYRKLVGVPGGL
ncbi:hypothetical protein DSCO28_06740 [Desulfosarcina ovata subsp. sediminis]|uniref:Type 4 fimbrial biogenesis protein PilX N-terminal domain-containing protein n=1 Tax=Desulfosarcina ovata subsp. sediminis TaxID=885957 RepID=A0A5K7ZD48_9BACT|nr:hypothetical protein [Desulfosarcina ovata]BBO80108.1 hypothetical protein DSCO28_06740 [Desulfosarcina ovata subsp. sediminis]